MSSSCAQPLQAGLRQRRPSSTMVNGVRTLEQKAEHTLLIPWDDLPPWRRDNAFIRSGYRQARASYGHSLRSLFYLHNESVNIRSHLVGAVVAVAGALYLYCVIHPRYASAAASDVLVFSCFFGGAAMCLGMSATFHALADHSEDVARWGNKLDYMGIVALIVGSYVPALYYGFFCRPMLLAVYLGLICLLGVGCAAVSWIEQFRTPRWRPYRATMFIGLGLSGVIPVIHGVTIYGCQALEDRMGVSWVIAQGAMYIFGAVLYAVRWPERSFPGAFDIWGSSHQIFHMFVLLAAATHFYGMATAFDHHHTVMGSQCLTEPFNW
ncbi:ADIPOR-like receptor IZH2 [Tolypocladium ophioglossoides CBS 100239]|uniref:ADIPOR-like receptor IZH2 n=1 Tax=Tolypocladium ophioglossoides (strain CBS 100239) TaxID=1163406 RepID=A0A0L0N5V1_TOLOC|nr:ADIPOR-like receptor IZH2 [Tolypocladium ophioglossoides CBS 100239]